jgi:hypothetical protein
MKEEKENMLLKFLGFFVGPIQFVMEVRQKEKPSRSLCFVCRQSKLETKQFPTCRLGTLC